MVLNYCGSGNSGFSIMDAAALFFIGGGSEIKDSSNEEGKGYDTTWEVSLSGEVTVDTNGKVEPKMSILYTVHK